MVQDEWILSKGEIKERKGKPIASSLNAELVIVPKPDKSFKKKLSETDFL